MDEDDDDFGDFGGFEAAEPVVPNVAQVGSLEASPSPWALMSSGNAVGVQPDLLINQNKFPPVLDPSVPPVQQEQPNQNQNNTYQLQNGAKPAFAANFGNESGLNQASNIDEVSLANDILDGSFRSTASTNSGASASPTFRSDQSNGVLHRSIPDVQDIAIGSSEASRAAADTNRVQSLDLNQPRLPDLGETSSQRTMLHAAGMTGGQETLKHSISSETSAIKIDKSKAENFSNSSHSVPVTDSPEITQSVVKPKDTKETDTDRTQDHAAELTTASSVDGLFEDLAFIDSTAKVMREIERESEKEIQTQHSEALAQELKAIREESHLAVMAVVEEYQDLMKSNLERQQETFNTELKKSLQEQQELFQKQQEEQQKLQEVALQEERDKMREEMKAELQNLMEKQKEEFETYLQDERTKSKAALETSLQEEREENVKNINQAMEEENKKTEKFLEEEVKSIEEKLKEERKKNEELFKKALEEEQEKSREALQKALENERLMCEESVKSVLEFSRDETKTHIEQQKQLDHAARQRQLASLDVFLESARRQLTLLMDGESHTEEKSYPNS